MANPKNRATVEEALRHELERDRTKTYVVEISPLGLVEMTRQNVTDGPREVMTRKCPTCDGDGIIVSDSTTALEIERKLRALVTPGGRAKAFKVELNSRIAALVVGPAASRLRELEETTKRRFFLVGRDDLHLDHFRVLEQGPVEQLAPESPVHAGEEIGVKLGQVDLHDPRAGVGTLDGLDVTVAGAAKLVGKKVRARVTAVLEGVAYAELLDRTEEPEQPITAEAEAEKPTRARRATKKAEEPEAGAALEVADEDPAADGAGEELAGAGETDGDEQAQTPKKRTTRRGTRGGRNRRKKPVAAAGAETDAEVSSADGEAAPEPEGEPVEAPAPVIHLPAPDLGRDDDDETENGDQPATPRKRTRRGSRGGRGRKRKTPAENGESVAEDDESVAEEVAVAVAEPAAREEAPESGAWEYTPMSEWGGLDDDRGG
jgi:ribonuclease G